MNLTTINDALPSQAEIDAEKERISEILADACKQRSNKAADSDISPMMKDYLKTQKQK